MAIGLDSVFVPSEDVVSRDIEGELMLVPLTAGFGDVEGLLYSVEGTAKAIWESLDGKKDLRGVVAELARSYSAASGEIERDVLGLVQELVRRRMVVEVPATR